MLLRPELFVEAAAEAAERLRATALRCCERLSAEELPACGTTVPCCLLTVL
jgi:hypothetical protein